MINFSGGGPQTDPASDALVEAVRNVVAAGVVPVISAGNDRDDYGLGSAGSPGTAPEAISVAALSNTHVYAPMLAVTTGRARAADADPVRARRRPGDARCVGIVRPDARRRRHDRRDERLARPRNLCGPPGNLDGGPSPLPRGSLRGAIALVSRGTCTFALKAARVRAAGGVGIVVVDNRPGEANGIPAELAVPGDGRRPRRPGARRLPHRPRRSRHRPDRAHAGPRSPPSERGRDELLVGRPDRIRPHAQAGRRRSRRPDPLRHAADRRRAVRRLRRDEHGRAARRRRGGAPAPAPPGVVAAPGEVGARVDRRPAWADTARSVEAPVLTAGSGLADVTTANDPKLFTDPVSLSFSDL